MGTLAARICAQPSNESMDCVWILPGFYLNWQFALRRWTVAAKYRMLGAVWPGKTKCGQPGAEPASKSMMENSVDLALSGFRLPLPNDSRVALSENHGT